MTEDDIKAAREIIAAATPALDVDGNEYYLGGIPFTDAASGKTVHRMVTYTAERFAERARVGWAEALDEIERLRQIIAALPCYPDCGSHWTCNACQSQGELHDPFEVTELKELRADNERLKPLVGGLVDEQRKLVQETTILRIQNIKLRAVAEAASVFEREHFKNNIELEDVLPRLLAALKALRGEK